MKRNDSAARVVPCQVVLAGGVAGHPCVAKSFSRLVSKCNAGWRTWVAGAVRNEGQADGVCARSFSQ